MKHQRFAVLVVAACFLIGCGKGEKPTDSYSKGKDATASKAPQPTPPGTPTPPAPPKKGPSEPGVATEALVKEYLANGEEAIKKYKNKNAVVEGVVVDKSKDEDQFKFVSLDGGKNKEGKPVKVKCNFPADARDSVIKVKKGDKVKIKGELTSLGLTGNDTELEMVICNFAD
jgi:hypothetical protein